MSPARGTRRLKLAIVACLVAVAAALWPWLVQPASDIEVDTAVALRVLAVRANNPSLAMIDLEAGAVTHYPPGRHALPGDAVDGAVITPRGETIVWTDGVARRFTGRLDRVDGTLRPDPLRRLDGVAPAVHVVPTLDGDAVWLVQPGVERHQDGDVHPTLVELIEVDTGRRLLRAELASNRAPVAVTGTGLVLNTHRLIDTGDGWTAEPATKRAQHLGRDGKVHDLGPGWAVAATGTEGHPHGVLVAGGGLRAARERTRRQP